MNYLDVHAHLTDKRFAPDLEQVIKNAMEAGLSDIVVNGLEPQSNRQIIELSKRYPVIKAAAGIYPAHAAHKLLEDSSIYKIEPFDIDDCINEIYTFAKNKEIVAVGECGLDGYHLKEHTFKQQESVFCQLIAIAKEADLPIIIHSRSLEIRALDILREQGVRKASFHCFTAKTALAVKHAEELGWCFSIPNNCVKDEHFKKMLSQLPLNCILTETDSPYLHPVRGTRNEPKYVVDTVALFATLRNFSVDEAKNVIWNNYQRLFYS